MLSRCSSIDTHDKSVTDISTINVKSPKEFSRVFIADLQLMTAAMAFGLGFVGQREAMIEGVGPLTFNALRYIISTIFVMIAAPVLSERTKPKSDKPLPAQVVVLLNVLPYSMYDFKAQFAQFSSFNETMKCWTLGCMLAVINFAGSTFQQVGIQSTSASESAFLSGFYIVFTPVFLLCIPWATSKPKLNTWIAVVVSILGLFIISDSSLINIHLGHGEVLSLFGAFFWTFHILLTDYATKYVDPVFLTTIQLFCTSIFCFFASYVFEYNEWNFRHIEASWPVIAMLGLVESTGFLFGALGQTHAPAHHAAIIFGSEVVWATLGGFLFIHEKFRRKEIMGCLFTIASTVISKLDCECRRFKITCK